MNEGAVHGSVRLWLRLEGLVVLLLATFCMRAQVGRGSPMPYYSSCPTSALPRTSPGRGSVLPSTT
jgi:hypothetical protein